eukprot:5653690-Pleurochrysis_carterae.AAC.1
MTQSLRPQSLALSSAVICIVQMTLTPYSSSTALPAICKLTAFTSEPQLLHHQRVCCWLSCVPLVPLLLYIPVPSILQFAYPRAGMEHDDALIFVAGCFQFVSQHEEQQSAALEVDNDDNETPQKEIEPLHVSAAPHAAASAKQNPVPALQKPRCSAGAKQQRPRSSTGEKKAGNGHGEHGRR